MFSVTTDPVSNPVFPGRAAGKAGKSDQSRGNDGFAALVDRRARPTAPTPAPTATRAAGCKPVRSAAPTTPQARRTAGDRATRPADRAAQERFRRPRRQRQKARRHRGRCRCAARRREARRLEAPSPRNRPRIRLPTRLPTRSRPAIPQPIRPPTPAQDTATAPEPVAVAIATAAAPNGCSCFDAGIRQCHGAACDRGRRHRRGHLAATASGQTNIDPDAATPAAAAADPDQDRREPRESRATAPRHSRAGQPATPTDASSTSGARAARPQPSRRKPPRPSRLSRRRRPEPRHADDPADARAGADPSASRRYRPRSRQHTSQQPAVAGKANSGHGAADAAKPDGAAASAANTAGRALRTSSRRLQAPTDPARCRSRARSSRSFTHRLGRGDRRRPVPISVATAARRCTGAPERPRAGDRGVARSSGKSRFEIRLDPAELGRIDVRIDVDKQRQRDLASDGGAAGNAGYAAPGCAPSCSRRWMTPA